MGNPIHLGEVIKFISFLFILLILITGVGVYFYKDNLWARNDVKALVRKEDRFSETASRSTKDPFVQFMDKHLRQTGFGKINSLQADGRFFMDGQVLDLLLLSKKPDFSRVQLRWADGIAASGHNGQSSWSVGGSQLENIFSIQPELLNASLSRFLAILPAGEWMYSSLGEKDKWAKSDLFEWQSGVQWKGRECNLLTNRYLGDPVIRHYYDPETGLEISREARLVLNGSGERHFQIDFRKPLEEGYPIPSGFELWVDGRIRGVAEFNSFKANRGILSCLFEVPELNSESEQL